ncbi:hypothetical protein N24_0675 [Corynebacterium suranareeae]|uniref:Oxidoreductase n=1 Tax=Corynebacterium suranareeae TaxID=2506452 RepID=A0A160PMA6_9CORY|nr:oxidoreductase [Corynebacterium suranareeae]BAU94937.1 hypothetical protein N24_0675 [Corynebacterium suranareeae]
MSFPSTLHLPLKALVLATAMWVVLALTPWVPSAHALTTPCDDDQVTVMVEGFTVGCAEPGGNGYQTLLDAGFDVETTMEFPDYLCRINNYPGPDVDECMTTSPAEAYWAYWHAPLGGDEWEYSNLGAFSYYPEAGTVEAWYWGDTDRPGAIPVSKTQAELGLDSQDPSYNYDGFDPSDFKTTTPTTSAPMADSGTDDSNEPSEAVIAGSGVGPAGGQGTAATAEINPENPNEVLVYQDSDGNSITKDDYEKLVAAAAAPQTTSAVQAPAGSGPAGETAIATEEDPMSTQVLVAPAGTDATNGTAESTPQIYATSAEESSTQGWIIGLTLAVISLVSASAVAAWAIRRSEIQG